MMDVDWQAVEDRLVREGLVQFPQIAANYPDEEFYGVFFDCDLVYLCAQAHLNTNAKLRQYAQRCKDEDLARKLQCHADKTVDDLIECSRWDGGGWGFFGIFYGPEFPEVAAARDHLYETVGSSEGDLLPLREAFMQMACRAVIRLERSGAFDRLHRTPDFRVLCVYIQETVEEGEARLEQVRAAFGPLS